MAFNIGAIEGTLELDRTPFQASLARAKEEGRQFSQEHITPTIDLGDKVAKAQLDDLRLKLDRLALKHVNVKVDVDRSAFSRIEGLFGSLGKGVGGIPFVGGLLSLPFKAVEGILSKLPSLLENVGKFATTAFQTIAGTINDLRTGATTATQVLGSLISGLISTVASGGAALVAFAALAVVFGAVASAVISLVAALAALAASFTAAIAGATALFIGAFAAAVPVIGVLVAFFTRLAAVVKAHQAAQQAATQAAQQHKAALQQQHQALLTLTSAQQNLKDQTVAAYAAMKQSAIDYQHALLGVENARLGIEGARLSLRQAKQDLRDFLSQASGANSDALLKAFTNVDFNPESARKIFAKSGQNISGDQLLQLQEKLFAVKQATLGVKNANSSYQDSLNALTQAEQKRNQFLSQGIAAYKPYEQALSQVAQAQDKLQTAMNRVSSAQIAYHQKLAALSTTEQGFLGTLTKIIAAFKQIAQQVAQPIFRGITSAFGSISGLLKDPAIQSGLVGIGRAIGGVIAQFGKTLSTKPWRDAITQFINAGAQLTTQGGKLFGGFLNVLREIAQAALPHVINGVKSLAGWFTDLGKRPGAIKSAVEFLVHQFKIWWDVAKALGGLIVAFLRNAAGAGGKLAEHLAHILRHWTDWLNTHPGAVKAFFDHSVTQTGKLLDNLGKILGTMIKIIAAIPKIADWLGNARRNAEHAVFGTGSINPSDVAADIGAAERDMALLHTHLTVQQRNQTRQRLLDNLNFLRKHWVTLSPTLEKVRENLTRATSSSVGDVGLGGPVVHFHAHGVQDPAHFIAQAAPKVAHHPAFRKARIDESRKRGK